MLQGTLGCKSGLGPALCATSGGARRSCGPTLALGPGSRARGGGAVLLCGSAENSCRGSKASGEWEAGCRRVRGGREGHPVAVANPWFESWSQARYISVVHFSETLVCGTNYEFLTHTVKHAQLRSQWAPLVLGCALLGSPCCVPFSVSCKVLTTQSANSVYVHHVCNKKWAGLL